MALTPREEPSVASLGDKVDPPGIPTWAKDRVSSLWWKQYGDPALDRDIECAFQCSPSLQAIGARLDLADARVKSARAAALPQLNLGYGFRLGRKKEVDFGPYDLAPWTGAANLRWELDIFDKIRRARESAEFDRRRVFWDLEAARLVLAVRITESRFRIYRLGEEIAILDEAIEANDNILAILEDREEAGLIAETEVFRMVAEGENLERARKELERLRSLSEVTLDTLKGGYPEERCEGLGGRLPGLPPIPYRCFDEMICCHPLLLSAESELRAAYRIEESARLDLLPTFRLRGNLMGVSPHFFLDELRAWTREFGPSLDIPVFEPQRHANLAAKRAGTDEATAGYRAALVDIAGDVDSAYINLFNRKEQYASSCREVEALGKARDFVTANLRAGIVSQIEVLESERSYFQASRTRVFFKEALLQDHVSLIRALGGGGRLSDCLPEVTADPVIKPTPIEALVQVRHPDRRLFGSKNKPE